MTRTQAIGIWGVAFGALAGAVAFFGAACEACSPSEVAAVKSAEQTIGADAQKSEAYLASGCAFTETAVEIIDPPAAGAVDLFCASAEAVDGAIASLAKVQVTAKLVRTELVSDAGAKPLYRVRCIVPALSRDAGRE